jgi:uncharacterized protein (DUF1810 family)
MVARDKYDMYLQAQNNKSSEDIQTIYQRALLELKAGKKQTHWMWFIFPQTPKPNMSDLSKKFALTSKEEAKAYLEHPTLGKRLVECTEAVLKHKDKTLEEIFGTALDVKKFKSSMMLFSHVDESGVFKEVLENCFNK